MNNIRRATLLFSTGLALVSLGLGSGGCPAQTVCPTCGLRLASPESATLSLSRFGEHADGELVRTEVVLSNRAGEQEKHAYPAEELPIPRGETVTVTGEQFYWVEKDVTYRAEVRMLYRDASGNEVLEATPIDVARQ